MRHDFLAFVSGVVLLSVVAYFFAPVVLWAWLLLEPIIGGPGCQRPYNASVLNISAMSFGSLSDNAILALSLGAALGKFAHNTGEGGISRYHRDGGDRHPSGLHSCRWRRRRDRCSDSGVYQSHWGTAL
jgi:hypothetical protein